MSETINYAGDLQDICQTLEAGFRTVATAILFASKGTDRGVPLAISECETLVAGIFTNQFHRKNGESDE